MSDPENIQNLPAPQSIEEHDARARAIADSYPLISVDSSYSDSHPSNGQVVQEKPTQTDKAQEVIERMRREAAARDAADDARRETANDVYEDYGGGMGTFNELGHVPPPVGEIVEHRIRLRGGQSALSFTLGNRQITVKMHESSNGVYYDKDPDEVRKTLLSGGGSLIRPSRRSK